MKGKDNVISTRDLPGMIITKDIEKGTVVSVKCNLGIFYTYAYFINYWNQEENTYGNVYITDSCAYICLT